MTRNTLCLFLGVAALWALWRVGTEATRDVAMLRFPGADYTNRYIRLWAVDDDGAIWLRAARPDREWLELLRAQPRVSLERGGVSRAYMAEIIEQPSLRERVDELMREKYGWADRTREWLLGRETVPVRLEPLD